MYNVETYTIMIILKGAKTTLSLSCKKVVYEIFISLQRKRILANYSEYIKFSFKTYSEEELWNQCKGIINHI